MLLKFCAIAGVLNILLLPKILCIIDENLLVEYFNLKSINNVVFFTCNSDIALFENIMKYNIYVSVNNIDLRNIKDIKNLEIEHGQQGFLLDADCKNVSVILNQCTEELFFDKYKWLIFAKNLTILNILQNISMNVNAEVTVALKTCTNWNLLDVYNPGYRHQGTLQINNLGTWDRATGFNFNKSMFLPKYIRRRDFTGLHFTGTIVLISNYSGELLDYLHNNDDNRIIDNFSRYYFLLFNHIKDIHNFTLTVKLDYIYGSIDTNGSFNGLVGSLQRKEIDFGLTPIYCKVDRTPFVDFLVPTYLMKTRFIFRHPKPVLTIRGSFFSPLSNVVWLCTWGIMMIIAILTKLAFQHEWKIERIKQDPENYTENDWSYTALLVFGGICQQDVPRVPNFYSSRTIIFISIFFTYMLYQFYSGGIVSSLLSEPPKTIKDLEDLLNSQLKIGVEDIVYEKDYFDQTTDPTAIELYKKKIAHKKNGSAAFYDVQTGMELVRKGGFAFQTDTSTGYAIIAEEYSNEIICQIGEVQLYPSTYTVGVVPQGSPFKELLIYSFQRMVEAGIVERQRLKWTTRKPECIKIVDSSTIFVGINEFFPAVLFYIVGILVSLLIFAVELWIYNRPNTFKCSFLYT